MSNRLNAAAGRLPTTEELDEDQDNDGSDGESGGGGERDVPNANVVGSGRRGSLTVSKQKTDVVSVEMLSLSYT